MLDTHTVCSVDGQATRAAPRQALRFALHVHLVFVTKYRRKVFDGDAIERLCPMFAKICKDLQAQLVEMDGEDDHVHLLVN
jgi:putative transposase